MRFRLQGLEEDAVWSQMRDLLPQLDNARENVKSILRYAFTEMLNNAIDHSGGSEARVTFWARPEQLAFEVRDDGVGVFQHIRDRLGFEDDLAALLQLTKGRETTAPERHTGQGIFFTSRMVDRFELDANRLLWIMDSERDDQAVGEAPEHPGTRVRCEVDPVTDRTPKEVFDQFVDAETFEFSRTVIPLILFQPAGSFVSRSEAKRVGTRLERFQEAVLDFQGMTEVGQGFVDELFRVWAAENPGTRLVPINMSPVVERMVRRSLSDM
jgi:anti-sigma regulatory factor (Ser/Thr protein kinase)